MLKEQDPHSAFVNVEMGNEEIIIFQGHFTELNPKEQTEHLEEAKKLYNQALENDPENVDAQIGP